MEILAIPPRLKKRSISEFAYHGTRQMADQNFPIANLRRESLIRLVKDGLSMTRHKFRGKLVTFDKLSHLCADEMPQFNVGASKGCGIRFRES